MKAVRLRLSGKVLRIELRELNFPLLFVFSENRLAVLYEWSGSVDCTVQSGCTVLRKLQDKRQLSSLMRSGELIVDGDIALIQQVITLLERAEWDPGEWLAPYFGDIVVESVEQMWRKSIIYFTSFLQRQRKNFAEIVTEEYQFTPSPLQVIAFNEEVNAFNEEVNAFNERVNALQTVVNTLSARLIMLESRPCQ